LQSQEAAKTDQVSENYQILTHPSLQSTMGASWYPQMLFWPFDCAWLEQFDFFRPFQGFSRDTVSNSPDWLWPIVGSCFSGWRHR
jgi:hypothetical protein